MSDKLKRSTFERLTIAKSYISMLEKENQVLKELVIQERDERLQERQSFIEARDNILSLKPQERAKIQADEQVKIWKNRAKILSGKIDRLEKENKTQKLALDRVISKLSAQQK